MKSRRRVQARYARVPFASEFSLYREHWPTKPWMIAWNKMDLADRSKVHHWHKAFTLQFPFTLCARICSFSLVQCMGFPRIGISQCLMCARVFSRRNNKLS